VTEPKEKAPTVEPRIIDLNQNGIPDYQEAWFYRALWGLLRGLTRTFAPEHTLVRRGVEAVDEAIQRELP
jgi:hypothetical protein